VCARARVGEKRRELIKKYVQINVLCEEKYYIFCTQI